MSLPDTNDAEARPKPSRLWRVLRWVPIAIMLLALSVLLVMFLAGGMLKISAWYLMQFIPPVLGFLSLVGTLVYALIKRKFSRLMLATLVTAVICLLPVFLIFNPTAFPASLERTEPTATVRLPADVPLKVAWGGDRIETNYHAIAPDQRWAYDLFVAPYITGSPNLEDYGCYGVPVVAPASGLVVAAHDGEPDETPGAASNNFAAPTGNHVVIELETKTYLVIAHLKEGSLSVEPGETVEEGQAIGECGNSGNTSEPHIHIHHQRQDPRVFPLNFAEGLPLFFRDHGGDPMPVGGFDMDGDDIIATGDTVQHIGN